MIKTKKTKSKNKHKSLQNNKLDIFLLSYSTREISCACHSLRDENSVEFWTVWPKGPSSN